MNHWRQPVLFDGPSPSFDIFFSQNRCFTAVLSGLVKIDNIDAVIGVNQHIAGVEIPVIYPVVGKSPY